MKKNKIKHQWNYEGAKGQVFTLPSQTIPDQALSMRDLLSRYVRGQDVPVYDAVYEDEEGTIPIDLERMTPQDRIELARSLGAEIENKRAEMQAKAKAKKDTVKPPAEAVPPVEEIEGGAQK